MIIHNIYMYSVYFCLFLEKHFSYCNDPMFLKTQALANGVDPD